MSSGLSEQLSYVLFETRSHGQDRAFAHVNGDLVEGRFDAAQDLPARNRRIELCLFIPEDEPAVAGREVNIPHSGRAVRTRREQDWRHQDVLADEELVVEVLVDRRVLRIVEEQRARDRQARPRPFVHCVVVELEHAVAQLDEPAADARHRFAVGVHLLVFLVIAEIVVAEPGQERAESASSARTALDR